jgi:integrase
VPEKPQDTDGPVPDSLRAELEAWLGTHDHRLIFSTKKGRAFRRSCEVIQNILVRVRTAAEIPDLTFRMCRTAFSTLFEGNIRDAQEILGHYSEEFTRKYYQKAIPERAAAAVNDLDRRLKVVEIRKKTDEDLEKVG